MPYQIYFTEADSLRDRNDWQWLRTSDRLYFRCADSAMTNDDACLRHDRSYCQQFFVHFTVTDMFNIFKRIKNQVNVYVARRCEVLSNMLILFLINDQ